MSELLPSWLGRSVDSSQYSLLFLFTDKVRDVERCLRKTLDPRLFKRRGQPNLALGLLLHEAGS